MAMRKKDGIAPFEIMRRPASGGPDVAGTPQPEPEPQPAPAGGGGAPWWVGSSSPLILRVPRGLAIVVVLGVVLLIIVAYMVGHARGADAVRAELAESVDQASARARGAPSAGFVVDHSGGDGDASAEGADPASTPRDPRVEGLNYLRLAQYPPDEARRLADFLAENGVATALDPVQNGRFLIVTAVDRGFDADALRSQARRAYEERMRTLGKDWRRHNNDRGDDLSSMLFVKHKGP